MTGTLRVETTLTAGVSGAVQIPAGLTLVGVDVPELTSTTFTIGHSSSESGTYKTLGDPLGTVASAGTAITFTIGATSIGVWMITPIVSALLSSWIKLTFDQSETAQVGLIFKDIA
jgi:hypothetical protein